MSGLETSGQTSWSITRQGPVANASLTMPPDVVMERLCNAAREANFTVAIAESRDAVTISSTHKAQLECTLSPDKSGGTTATATLNLRNALPKYLKILSVVVIVSFLLRMAGPRIPLTSDPVGIFDLAFMVIVGSYLAFYKQPALRRDGTRLQELFDRSLNQ